MKFVKGVMIGSLITTGAIMWYSEATNQTKKKMAKKGRTLIKKMGIV